LRQILIAGAFALIFSIFGTRVLIGALARKGYGQIIREDGPSSHHIKHGTPTMGGIIFILAAILGYLFAHVITGNPVTASALLVIGLVVALGFVGFLDDWLKVTRQNSRGLPGRYKLLGQAVAAGVFGYLGLQFADKDSLTPISEYLSGVRETTIYLGPALVIVFIIVMVMAASNGVNLTDGLDGLATGASIMTFMGDTGSLALGGAIAGLAATLRVELLLIPLGGLFVIITMSVLIQTGYFKLSGGKRVFKMAPLHHHFELIGWAQITIVIRFWIIAGLCVAIGLGLFYAQWVVK